jgi:peptidoglycan-N-acetylglucosamine deacetylase
VVIVYNARAAGNLDSDRRSQHTVGGKIAFPIVAAAAGAMAYAARGRSSAFFGPSVYRGPHSCRAIALTFDDGPSPSTPVLLDLLDASGAKATFFQVGMHVRRLPEIARSIVDAGHEVGNHTNSHAALWLRSAEFIDKEIGQAQDAIQHATGGTPVLFRAPYGVRWFGLDQAQRHYGLTGVMWTALGRDWRLPAAEVTERLLSRAENGAIFCLHDGRERTTVPDISNTIAAVRELVPRLADAGYSFCTVSELLRAGRVE